MCHVRSQHQVAQVEQDITLSRFANLCDGPPKTLPWSPPQGLFLRGGFFSPTGGKVVVVGCLLVGCWWWWRTSALNGVLEDVVSLQKSAKLSVDPFKDQPPPRKPTYPLKKTQRGEKRIVLFPRYDMLVPWVG